MKILVYADSSFSSKDDLTLKTGYILILGNSKNRAHILDYSSKKSKLAVHSIMAGELCAFMDAFDVTMLIANDLANLLGRMLPVKVFTEAEQLFDALTPGKITNKQRLLIYISTDREAYKRFEITRIGLIRGDESLAQWANKKIVRREARNTTWIYSGR